MLLFEEKVISGIKTQLTYKKKYFGLKKQLLEKTEELENKLIKTNYWTWGNVSRIQEFSYEINEDGKFQKHGKDERFGIEMHTIRHYVNDKLHGEWIDIVNKKIFSKKNYKDGKLDGEAIIYNEDGTIEKKSIYNNGELI